MLKKRKRSKPTDEQFVREFARMVTEDLAKFSPEERMARLRAAERRLSEICGAPSTGSRTVEPYPTALIARTRHEER